MKLFSNMSRFLCLILCIGLLTACFTGCEEMEKLESAMGFHKQEEENRDPLAALEGAMFMDGNNTVIVVKPGENGDGSYSYIIEAEKITEGASGEMEGTWCSTRGQYYEDGLFYLCKGEIWNFNSDGTFTCTDTETQFVYDTNGTQRNIYGAGSLDKKGTYTFDGTTLVITITHRCYESGGSYYELDKPTSYITTVTFENGIAIVDWGNKVEKFYRETNEDALAKILMQEQQ